MRDGFMNRMTSIIGTFISLFFSGALAATATDCHVGAGRFLERWLY
jgi:hypothetical protein